MSLTVTECVRSLNGVPVFRTVVTSHLWATQISGHPLQLPLTRTPTTVPPMLPLGSHHLPRYEVWTTEHIKDFQMTINLMFAAGCMSKQLGCFNRVELCIQLTPVFVWPVGLKFWPEPGPIYLGFCQQILTNQLNPREEYPKHKGDGACKCICMINKIRTNLLLRVSWSWLAV